MNKSIFLFVLLITSVGYAKKTVNCEGDYKDLRNKKITRLEKLRSTTVDNKADEQALPDIEKRALYYYMDHFTEKDLDGADSDPAEFEIKVSAYYDRESDQLTGYLVKINDTYDDESLVEMTYSYQRVRKSNRPARWMARLLKTYWHNQSPVEEWVCELYSTKKGFK